MNEQYIEWMRRLNDEIGRVSGIPLGDGELGIFSQEVLDRNLPTVGETVGGSISTTVTYDPPREDQRRVSPGWRQIASESNAAEHTELTVETLREWVTDLYHRRSQHRNAVLYTGSEEYGRMFHEALQSEANRFLDSSEEYKWHLAGDEVFKNKEILPNGYGHEVKKVDIF